MLRIELSCFALFNVSELMSSRMLSFLDSIMGIFVVPTSAQISAIIFRPPNFWSNVERSFRYASKVFDIHAGVSSFLNANQKVSDVLTFALLKFNDGLNTNH